MTLRVAPAALAFVAILLAVVVSHGTRAQNATPGNQPGSAASVCAAFDRPVKVKMKNPKGRVVYNTGVSRNDLVRIRKSRSRGVQNSNWKPLGLTLSDFLFKIATSVKLQPTADNKFCVYPSSFDVSIGYSGFKVYIDRRYGKGSCEYRAVLDHENTHVSLYRRNLAHSLPNLQRAVHSAARLLKPVIVNTPAQGARYMQKQMEKKLKPLVARLNRGADIANGRIDTPISYKKVQGRCRNW